MKVKALGKEYQVKDITYKERRDLHRLNAKAFWDGKVNPDNYYDVLENDIGYIMLSSSQKGSLIRTFCVLSNFNNIYSKRERCDEEYNNNTNNNNQFHLPTRL